MTPTARGRRAQAVPGAGEDRRQVPPHAGLCLRRPARRTPGHCPHRHQIKNDYTFTLLALEILFGAGVGSRGLGGLLQFGDQAGHERRQLAVAG